MFLRVEALPTELRNHMNALAARPSVVDDPTVLQNELDFCEKLAGEECPSCGERIALTDGMWFCAECKHTTVISK